MDGAVPDGGKGPPIAPEYDNTPEKVQIDGIRDENGEPTAEQDQAMDDIIEQSPDPSGVSIMTNSSLNGSFCADFQRIRDERDRLQRERDCAVERHQQQMICNAQLQQQNQTLIERVNSLLEKMEEMNRNLTNSKAPATEQNPVPSANKPNDTNALPAPSGPCPKRGNCDLVDDDVIGGGNRRTNEFKRRRIVPKRKIVIASNALYANINASPHLQKHFSEVVRLGKDGNNNALRIERGDVSGIMAGVKTLDDTTVNDAADRANNNENYCFNDIDTENRMDTNFSFEPPHSSTALKSIAIKPIDFNGTFPSPYFGFGNVNGADGVAQNLASATGNAQNGEAAILGSRLNGKTWAQLVGQPAASVSDATTKTVRPSPIQLARSHRGEYERILNGLRAHVGDQNFQWHEMTAGGTPRILAANMDAKCKIMTWLEANQSQFNSYAESALKRRAFLVRGMAEENEDNNKRALTEALRAAGIGGNIVINPFVTGYMRLNPDARHARLYQVIVDHDIDEKLLSGITLVGQFRVRFEKMRSSKVTQCHRCQRLGHTATHCAYNYRCVQCVSLHSPGACPRLANRLLPLECVNCLASKLEHIGHTANDLKHCQYFINRTDKINRKNAGHTQAQPKNPTSQTQVPAVLALPGPSAATKPSKPRGTRSDATATPAGSGTIIEKVMANDGSGRSSRKRRGVNAKVSTLPPAAAAGSSNGITKIVPSTSKAGTNGPISSDGHTNSCGAPNNDNCEDIGSLIQMLIVALNNFSPKCQ